MPPLLTEALERNAALRSEIAASNEELETRRLAILAGEPDASTGNNTHDALIAYYGADIGNRPETVQTWESFAQRFDGKVGEAVLVVQRQPSSNSYDTDSGGSGSQDYVYTTVRMGIVPEVLLSFTDSSIALNAADQQWTVFRHTPALYREKTKTDVRTVDAPVVLAASLRPWNGRSDNITDRLDQRVDTYNEGRYEVYVLGKDDAAQTALEVIVGNEAVQQWLTASGRVEQYGSDIQALTA